MRWIPFLLLFAAVFYKSERGHDILGHLGHEYVNRSDRNTPTARTWRCRQHKKYKCRATAVSRGLDVRVNGEHNHAGDQAQVEASKIKSDLKEAASSQPTASTRNILGQALGGSSNDVLARLPKRATLEDNVRRAKRRDNAPAPNPQSKNFEIPDCYADFVLHDSGRDDDQRILAFGHADLLAALSYDTWFGDGTFTLVPGIYFQLYTIHAKVGSKYPPCIYFLLPNKTENTYKRMIDIVKTLVPNLAPMTVLLDFERAALNAFQDGFPTSRISGCFFHLSQSIIRKVQELGLKRRYETDIDFSILVKSLSALAFVPVADVPDLFAELTEEFPDEPECNDLINYFQATYIRGPGRRFRDPRFPIELWNHFTDAMFCEPKTTNCVEGFHNALMSLFHCAHPTVWTLFDRIKKDVSIHRLDIVAVGVANAALPRSKYTRLADRLAEKVAQYPNENDKIRYLRAIAHING